MKRQETTGQNVQQQTTHCALSFFSTHGAVLRTIAVSVIVCTVTAAVFSMRSPRRPAGPPPQTRQTEDLVAIPVRPPLRTEQEVAALKETEVKLAEVLLKEFPDTDDALTIMANLRYRHGNAIEAMRLWNKALQINPKRADVYTSMGWASLKSGNFDQAVAQYRKALEIQPKLREVRTNMGRALIMSGRHDEAITPLTEETRLWPAADLAHFLLGQVYLQQKEYEKAKVSYEAALKIEPRYANAHYGLVAVCAKLGNRNEAKAHSQRFRELKAEARKHLKGRKIEYDDFSHTQKEAAITYINVGRMYRDKASLAKAEGLLREAAGLDPENVVAFLELASLYQGSGRPAQALQMHKRIVALQPQARMCHLMIGVLSGSLRRFAESEAAFRKVIALAPRRSEGYRELARLYLKFGRNFPQARQLAEKALSLEKIAANYFIVGWACYQTGDFATAQPAVRRAMELEPNNKQYPKLYALIQQRIGTHAPQR
ncbi:MAG: tetratricopeptide repeat protein [Planctomycetota bacterium]|jgi:tetratricopeptide (TPR) repeat protein